MKGPKVKISTGRINIEVAMESSEQADWHATQLASMLFQALEEEQEEVTTEPEETMPEEQKKEQEDELPEELPEESFEIDENIRGGVETENAPDEKKKVKGFVYIKCIHCGAISGRCLKNQADHFTCPECGKETELDDLRELSVNCECGKRFFYQTNLKMKMFDINCLECGAPVAVFWNDKKEKYETMRR